jgi:ABC-2 type transport system permease protein
MMGRSLPVARREYLERVRSKAFLIGTFVGPILMAALMIGPSLLATRQRGKPLKVAVLDASGALKASVEEALAARKAGGENRFLIQPVAAARIEEQRATLKESVLAGRLDGYLYLPLDALEKSKAEYVGRNVSNRLDLRLMETAVEDALITRRLADEGLDPARVRELTRRLDLETIRLSESGTRVDRGVTFIFATILMMMLYVTVLMWGQALMTGVIEEKSSRVVELAVSAMSPWSLLFGKLVGIGAAGLTQLGVWVGSLVLLAGYSSAFLPSDTSLPEITPLILASFLIYFLLGYFLYAALYAAIGAAVNTMQEAQSLVFPVLMPLIGSMVFFPVVLQSPDSTISVVLSLIPFATPLLMFLRITVLTPPVWQILLSIVLTTLTIAGVTWVSARIYRVGILMYGKRPTFPEMLRWVRHP